LDGVTAVGFDPIPGLLRDQGGGHDPADIPFFRQIAIEPIPAGAGFIDEDEVFALRVQLPNEHVDVTLAGADATERNHLGIVFFRDIGDSNRLFMNIHSDIKRARLMHG
jgi:hypothetical protein